MTADNGAPAQNRCALVMHTLLRRPYRGLYGNFNIWRDFFCPVYSMGKHAAEPQLVPQSHETAEATWKTGPTPVGLWAQRRTSSTCAQGWNAARPLWTQHCSCRYIRQFGEGGGSSCPAWGSELLIHRSQLLAGHCERTLIGQSGQQHQAGDSRRSLERLFRVPAAGVSSSGLCSSAAAAAAAAAGLGMGLGRGASMGGSEGFSSSACPADPPLACRMDALKSRTPVQHHRPLSTGEVSTGF